MRGDENRSPISAIRFHCWDFTGTVNRKLPLGTLNGLWNTASFFLPLTGIATTKRVTYVITMRRWSKDFSTLGIVSNFGSSWNQECLGSPRCAGRPVGGVGVGAR